MKRFFKLNIFLFSLLTLVSCENWLDVNENLNTTTKGRVDLLLPSAQMHMFTYTSGFQDASVGAVAGTIMHQVVSTGDSYNVRSTDFGVNESWDAIYGGIQDLEEVIRIAGVNGDNQYIGIAKLLKAYNFSLLVDLWGDVPYSEANKMPLIQYPKFDKGEDVYNSLFSLIDEGVEFLKKEDKGSEISSSDLVYNGDTQKWIKLANSLKLKMYNQMRLVSTFDAAAVKALVLENNFIDAESAFEINYGKSKLPENRNPMYAKEYKDPKGHGYLISHWLYASMVGEKGYISLLEDIKDPRVPYYFYKQEAKSESRVDFTLGRFYTTRFGSHGEHIATNFKNFTALGVYPCGGKYDDDTMLPGDDTQANQKGSGIAPMRLLSFHDILFIRAELAQANITTEVSKDLFKEAVEAAFAKVNTIAKNVDGAPALEVASRDAFITSLLAKYDASPLESIITQKWIASFANPVDSYSDYRRTGFPKLFDPNTDTDDETYTSYKFPVVFPYPNSTANANNNMPKDQNITSSRIFWDVK